MVSLVVDAGERRAQILRQARESQNVEIGGAPALAQAIEVARALHIAMAELLKQRAQIGVAFKFRAELHQALHR